MTVSPTGLASLDIAPLLSPDRDMDRMDETRHADQCYLCGRGLTEKALAGSWWLHLVDGGTAVAAADDRSHDGAGSDLGWFALGSECAKRVPISHRSRTIL